MQMYLFDELEKDEMWMIIDKQQKQIDNLRRGLFSRVVAQQKEIDRLKELKEEKIVQFEFSFIG